MGVVLLLSVEEVELESQVSSLPYRDVAKNEETAILVVDIFQAMKRRGSLSDHLRSREDFIGVGINQVGVHEKIRAEEEVSAEDVRLQAVVTMRAGSTYCAGSFTTLTFISTIGGGSIALRTVDG